MSATLTEIIAYLIANETLPLMFLLGFVVWMLSTAVGGGGPALYLPALAFVAPVREIAPITSVTAGIVSLHRVMLFYRHINWQILLWLLPGSALGATVGVHIFSSIGEAWLMPLMAAFLLVNSVVMLLPPRQQKILVRHWYFLPAGVFFSGVSTVVGASGQGINTLFIGKEIAKEQMIATKAVDAVLVQTIKLVGYIHIAAIGSHVLLLGVVAAAGAICGNYVGKWWLSRITEVYFRRVTAIMLLVSALLILYRFFSLD